MNSSPSRVEDRQWSSFSTAEATVGSKIDQGGQSIVLDEVLKRQNATSPSQFDCVQTIFSCRLLPVGCRSKVGQHSFLFWGYVMCPKIIKWRILV